MTSITGDITAVPCFRSAHRVIRLEAGIRILRGMPSAYCAMTYTGGATPKIIGEYGDAWDELLLRLKEDETNVTHWLLGRLPALNDPSGTIVALVDPGILDVLILPTQPRLQLKVQIAHPQIQRINDILFHYGWLTEVPRKDHPFDYFYYGGDIK